MSNLSTRILSSGLPLVVERIPGVRSVGLTWLLPAGSARDPDDRQGRSAIISEMINRGAGDLGSREHADALDTLGVGKGTGVETFHLSLKATLLGSRLREALPLLVDMVRRPKMSLEDVEPSRDLCLQAVESLKDSPQERVMVLLKSKHAPSPINRSGLGTIEGLRRVTAEELAPAWRSSAVPKGGAVLALAGDVDPDAATAQLDQLLADWTGEAQPLKWGTPINRGYHHEPDPTNQVHIAIAHDAPSENSPDAWLERIVTAILSGGMSGRLFTEVREKRSLCYSVYASYSSEATFGRGTAYSGTTPERAQETLDVLLGELHRINCPAGRADRGEFERAVIGMKSRLVMSGESTGSRANAIARDYARIGRPRSLDEMTKAIDAITLEQVNDYLARRSLGTITIATIGPSELKSGL
ncbi:MAG TPA: pitrilysin family protein [Phycisphaerales bacterium]|nr:pitrilysin family protein [Phycisphaerales bacterium]